MRKTLLCSLCVLLLSLAGASAALALTFDEFRGKAAELIDHKTKPDAFIKLCNTVLAKDASDNAEYKAYVYAMRGHAYWQKNDLKKSQADAEQAIATNPETEMGRMILLDALSGQGKYEEAAKQADILAEKANDAEKKTYFAETAANLRLEAGAIAPAVLWKAFDDNEVAAEDAYKDKIVAVKGKIDAITTSPTGYPQVSFNADKYGIHKVVCEFAKESKPAIAKLKKGQQILIAGKCRGMVMKSVFLKDSKIIE